MLKLGTIFPLLAIPFGLYMALTAASGGDAWLSSSALNLAMPSGRSMTLTSGDIFTFVSLTLLFVEVVKAVYTGAQGIINHGLSVLVLVVCCIMFSTSLNYTTVPFLLLTMMALLDVVAGVAISIVSARRDIGTGTTHQF